MLFLFSHVEYCDMHYVYGYCDSNANAAVNEYRRRYPERRIPSKRVFTRVEQALRRRIFAAAEQIRNHPHNIACATGSLKIRAENCIATGGGHFEQAL